MSSTKTNLSNEKVISFDEISKNNKENEPFAKGFYHWVMFLLSLNTRVKEELKIDFESFFILQVVVSHSLYQINKTGKKTYTELEDQFSRILLNKNTKFNKLTFSSISEVLQLPRETVRRKVIGLNKKEILEFDNDAGIKLGPAYKTIYKEFVKKTTSDISAVIKKWKKSGELENLLEL